eukprot:jgi/Botrbrau1/4542/Bobra.60_2s0030.1
MGRPCGTLSPAFGPRMRPPCGIISAPFFPTYTYGYTYIHIWKPLVKHHPPLLRPPCGTLPTFLSRTGPPFGTLSATFGPRIYVYGTTRL